MKSVENMGTSEIESEVIIRWKPKTKVKTVRLEPIMMPIRRENLLLFRQEMERESSGKVVPKDRIVAPISDSEIPAFLAISEERTTAMRELIITTPNPMQTKTKSLIKLAFHTIPLLVKIIFFFAE